MPAIQSIETWIFRKPRPPQYEAQGHRFWPESRSCVVNVTDEDGVEGVCSCISEFSKKVPQAHLHDISIPLMLGRDLYDRELIWHDLWDCDRRARFLPLPGTIDVALGEIAAKRANLPLYRFLGATRTSLPVYYSGQFMDVVDETK